MTAANKKTAKPAQTDTLAALSTVFGIVSLLGPGLLMGIPAIILASISLKRDTPGRGLSIAGLVMGIVSTVLSLLFIAVVIFIFIWAANNNFDTFYDDSYYPHYEEMPAWQQIHT